MMSQLVKIGIRPTIDGRQMGVRESLEDQTMGMAQRAAHFIQENIRHASGEKVECVLADSCIGGVAESAATADKFKRENVGLVLTVTPCWCYGTETIDMDPHTPKAIWGFNGTERPGAVYLAAAMAGHSQVGLPAFSIYGKEVQDAGDESIPSDVQDKILRFCRAGLAVASMRGKSYLSMGSVSMGIAGSVVNPEFFQKYLGMRNEYVDMTEIKRRLDREVYDKKEFELARAWVRDWCKEGKDYNGTPFTEERKAEDWDTVIKMTMIMRDLMRGNPKLADLGFGEESLGHNAILAGFQGQRHWTDHLPNGDFSEAILNSSFDWNGIREPICVATENDALNGVNMMLGKLLTGEAQVFHDVRTYWSEDAVERVTGTRPDSGFLHLVNSGSAALDGAGKAKTADGKPAMKPHWELTQADVEASLNATKWCPAIEEYFRGGGFSSQFLTEGGMPFTMHRINIIAGIGPVLQIAEGHSIELPEDVHNTLNERTNATWPTTWFVPRLTGQGAFKSVYEVMANWGANHCVITSGHVGGDLISLAAMLRIPVSMHNVDSQDIFRPHTWSAFGQDVEGQDYRACQNFGPIYK
ncbi:L-fucose isomerase [Vibrio crassostreae]|nr:L-fucose isomerase [Vibrio crassostreae]TCT50242.1 L-fucose isomerase [Vibrio crassostreae]TCT65088.1 L-fucose isomerase [Vibrio crassostreae]TCT75310.1 L-fucose isomerase [Vibrio crassostreae]TCT94265.1 L-fucose isomerase [Vibrio crassostreae]